MNNIKAVMEVLGEENSEKLKSSITDIIIDNISRDFDNYNSYILDPDEVQDFINNCKEEAFNRIKEDVINDMVKKIKECI